MAELSDHFYWHKQVVDPREADWLDPEVIGGWANACRMLARCPGNEELARNGLILSSRLGEASIYQVVEVADPSIVVDQVSIHPGSLDLQIPALQN